MNTQNNNHNKKERLIDSAAMLFHRNGLVVTSLADIAKNADIPIGNVYYYFKTKDELALAAINKRREEFANLYRFFSENIANPRERLIEAVRYYGNSGDDYARYGCPIGKIISDTDPEKDLISKSAVSVFADFIAWAVAQFEQLGYEKAEASHYAISLVAGIQGAIIMAKTFQTPQIIADESVRLIEWLSSIPNRKIQLGKVGQVLCSV